MRAAQRSSSRSAKGRGCGTSWRGRRTALYPLLAAHRDETIRVWSRNCAARRHASRLLERADGTAERNYETRFLLPIATEETRATLDLYERHLLAGASGASAVAGRSVNLRQMRESFSFGDAYPARAEFCADAGPGRRCDAGVSAIAGPRATMRRERTLWDEYLVDLTAITKLTELTEFLWKKTSNEIAQTCRFPKSCGRQFGNEGSIQHELVPSNSVNFRKYPKFRQNNINIK